MRKVRRQLQQVRHDRQVRFFHARQEGWLVDDLQDLQCDGGGQRIAAVGRAVAAHAQVLGDLGGGEHRTDRVAVAQRLGRRQHVRLDVHLLVGEQRAGAAHARLDFVEDQQRAGLVAQLAQRFQVVRVARNDAALALDRLDDHGRDIIGNRGARGLDVVVRDVTQFRWQRLEAFGVFRLATDRHGKQRAAVERGQARDDARLVRTEFGMRVFTGELERRFVGFGARVAEERALGERRFGQGTGQAQHRLVGVAVAEVPEGVELFGQRFVHFRMGMAQRGDGDARGEVQILLAFLVPQVQARCAHRHHGGRGVGRDQDVVEGLAGDRPRGDTRIKLSVHGVFLIQSM